MARLNVPLTVEAKDAKSEIAAFNKELRSVEQTSRLTTKELELNGRYTDALAAKQRSLTEQLKIQGEVTSKTKDGYAAQNKQLEELRARVEAAAKALEDSKASGSASEKELTKLGAALTLANREYEVGVKRLGDWERQVAQSEAKERLHAAAIANTTRELEVQSNQIGTVMQMFAGSLSAQAVAGVMRGVFSGLDEASKSAKEMAENQGRLTQVMRNTMEASDAQVGSIHTLTAAQQELGVVSQTVQTAGAQELATYLTKADTLKALIPVMNDMVVQQNGINASSQSAVNIATMLGKVMDGQVGALSRYGYKFDEVQANILKTGSEAERAAVLIDVISASVGGMNEALAKTDAGKQAQLNFVLNDTKQAIGEIYAALGAEAGAAALPAVRELSASLLAMVEDNKDNIEALFGVITGLFQFVLKNAPAVAAGFAAIGGAMAVSKVAQFASGMQTAAAAVNAVRMAAGRAAAAQAAQALATKALSAAQVEEAAAGGAATLAKVGLTGATNVNTAANVANAASIKALTVAMMSNPLFIGMAVAGVVMGIVKAIDYLSSGYERQAKKVQELSDEYNKFKNEADETERKLRNISDRMDELRGQDSLTLIEQQELAKLDEANDKLLMQLDIQRRLADIKAQETDDETVKLLLKRVTAYGAEGQRGMLEKMTLPDSVMRNIEYFDELAKKIAELEAEQTKLEKSGEQLSFQYKENAADLVFYRERSDELHKSILEDSQTLDGYREKLAGTSDASREMAASIDNVQIAVNEHNKAVDAAEAAQKKLEDTINGVTDNANKMNEALAKARAELNESTKSFDELNAKYRDGEVSGKKYIETLKSQANAARELAARYPELKDAFNALADIIESRMVRSAEYFNELRSASEGLVSETDALTRAFTEQAKAGELSHATAMKLIDAGYALAVQVDKETGKVTLNEEMYRLLVDAKLADQIVTLQSARATALIEKHKLEAEAARLAADGYEDLANAKMVEASVSGQSAVETKRQIELLNSLRERLAKTSVSGIRSDLEKPDTKKADKARQEELAKWKEYWKLLEEDEKDWIDKKKFYGEVTLREEAAHYDKMAALMRDGLAQSKDIAFADADEKAAIARDFNKRIESYERLKYTAEQNIMKASLSDWRGYWQEREDITKEFIDREKFYGRLSSGDEAAMYDDMIAAARTTLDEVTQLTYLSADEREAIEKELNKRIDGYQRQRYASERKSIEESIADAEFYRGVQERAVQRELDNTDDAGAKYKAYADLRLAAEKKLYDELEVIRSKFWLSEKEALREITAAHEAYAVAVSDIDKKMLDMRRERLTEQANEWYEAERKGLEERQRLEQKALTDQYQERKRALNRELELIREHYAALDAEEKKYERGRELADLQQQEGIYRGAATMAGREKYKSIVDQIERLQREADKELRDEDQRRREAEVTLKATNLDKTYNAQMEAMKAAYDEQKSNLTKTHEDMKEAAVALAKGTAIALNAAGEQVSDGVQDMFDKFEDGVGDLTVGITDKLTELVKQIEAVFKDLNFTIQTGALGGTTGGVTNNRTANMNVYDYSSNTYATPQSERQKWYETSSLLLAGMINVGR